MSYSFDPSGQNTDLPTDQEAEDAFYRDHSKCIQCGKMVCIQNDDGTIDCGGCSYEMGQMLHDELGRDVDVIHDDCREKHALEIAVHHIVAAFRTRMPLGLAVEIEDGARNAVAAMQLELEIKLKG